MVAVKDSVAVLGLAVAVDPVAVAGPVVVVLVDFVPQVRLNSQWLHRHPER